MTNLITLGSANVIFRMLPILRYSLLRARRQGREVPLLLPSDYYFTVPKKTRSIAGQVCSCRLCALGCLNGSALLQFKGEMKARREGRGGLDNTLLHGGVKNFI